MSRELLCEVRDSLREMNAISNEREFCESWLGKSECYLRTLRAKDIPPSADALSTLASKLGYYAKHLSKSTKPEHYEYSERFIKLRGLCQQAMEEQARAKWMTPERMGL